VLNHYILRPGEYYSRKKAEEKRKIHIFEIVFRFAWSWHWKSDGFSCTALADPRGYEIRELIPARTISKALLVLFLRNS